MQRRLVLWGFVLAAGILILAGWESYRNTIRFAEASEWRKHSYEVLGKVTELQGLLVDAETGQRGYLLTGNSTYLEPYRSAISDVRRTLQDLKTLTSDNPIQQQRLQTLEPLVEEKLSELRHTIDLRTTEGLPAAQARVLEGFGKKSMDQIRVQLSGMKNEENGLLKIRIEKNNQSVTRSEHGALGATMLSVSLLVLSFGLLRRELAERAKAQEALTKSEKWFSTTLGSIGDAVIATDLNGGVTFMNSIAVSLTGWSQEEAIGKPLDLVFNIVNKDTRRPVENPVKKVAREGKAVGLADHTLLLCKDGREFDIEDSAAPILTNKGEGFGIVLVFRDITEKKGTEEETKRQKDLLQLILESVGDGVVVADENGKFLLFNRAAEEVLGTGPTDKGSELWAKHFGAYLPDTITPYPSEQLPLPRAMRGEVVDSTEVFVRSANVPEGRLLSISGAPLKGEDGALRGGVVILRDITTEKRAQKALQKAKNEAERVSRLKDQFLSTMSHELRTPLNAILGFSELLPDERYGPLNERQRRYVAHIHTSGQHLLSLINDILDLSKIEAGRLELDFESVPVEAAFTEVLSVLRPLANKKSQTLVQKGGHNLNVRADATRFKQILMNLVGNAIKFSPEGGRIEMAVSLIDGKILVEVSDTGPGISAEEQKRIFETFYRARGSEKSIEGTGLGLAITQKLVALHGGELALDSQMGHGSRFYFSLSLAIAISQRRPAQGGSITKASDGPKVLVIEDDPATAQLIELQLMSVGYEVVVCDQPQHAGRMARELQPNAITLDLLMKPKNGWEVLAELRGDPRTASIPVIVITIADQPGSGAIVGADEYLVKPVDRTALLAALERCLGNAVVPRAQSILVVEDDAPTREFISELLTTGGHAVITAIDAAEARAHVRTVLPQLVILDLMLPGVSGLELLAEWRANLRTADLPVFVLTSKDLSHEEELYLRNHAEHLFRKQQPWQEALTSEVHRVVRLGQMEDA